MRGPSAVLLLAATSSLTLVACATPQVPSGPGPGQAAATSPPSGTNLVPTGYTGRFQAFAAVLESPHHGPQLCDYMLQSLPPQCGGPDLVGWDWSAVEYESVNGTTWGEYLVTGTWDAATMTFTLTEPAVDRDEVPASALPSYSEPDFGSPCPTPAGGWRPVDPATATSETLDEAIAAARDEADFAGAWLDQSYLPETGWAEHEANDPQRLVLNLRFTGDLARHEAQIRDIWGGALCLSRATKPLADLQSIADEITAALQPLTVGADEAAGVVRVRVMVATETAQQDLDARYGPGVVVLEGWLRPID